MAINTQNIRVDLNPGRPIPVAYAHQNDNNREFTFTLYNNGVAYTPSSTTAKFGYKSPIVNGQYSVIAGNSMATGTVSGNTVTVTLPNTYTAVSGVGLLTMILTTSGNTLRPVNIKFVVQSSADGDDVVLGASDWPAGLYEYMDDWMAENEPTEIANLKSDLSVDVSSRYCTIIETEGESKINVTPSSTNTVHHSGKNMIRTRATTGTKNGIDFTVNNDGSVLINGTSTAQATSGGVSVGQSFLRYLPKGHYKLSGNLKDENNNIIAYAVLYGWYANNEAISQTTIQTSQKDVVEFDVIEPFWGAIIARVPAGCTLDNQVMYPILTLDKSIDWEPFQKEEITTDSEVSSYGTTNIFWSDTLFSLSYFAKRLPPFTTVSPTQYGYVNLDDITEFLNTAIYNIDLNGNQYIVSGVVDCKFNKITNGSLVMKFTDENNYGQLCFNNKNSIAVDNIDFVGDGLFTSAGSSTTGLYPNVLIDKCRNVRLSHLSFFETHTPISVIGSEHVTIDNVVSAYSNSYGISIGERENVIGGTNDVTVSDCDISFAYEGIKFGRYASNVKVVRCASHNNNGDGIDCALVYGTNFLFADNFIYSNTGHGIEFKALNSTYVPDGATQRGIGNGLIRNNIIFNNSNSGISVQNNGVILSQNDDDETVEADILCSVEATILDNIITARNRARGIRIATGISKENIKNRIFVSRNQVYHSGQNTSYGGINCRSSSDLICKDNYINGGFQVGVFLQATFIGDIVGNVLENNAMIDCDNDIKIDAIYIDTVLIYNTNDFITAASLVDSGTNTHIIDRT